MGHEMPLAGDHGCWGRCFIVMVHSTPIIEFPGGGAPLRHPGHSVWYSDLAACNAWQAVGPGWRFLIWWCPGACTVHTVCEVWCPPDGKSCCATWGTAMLRWMLKHLHSICGWGMWSCSVLRVHQQFSVNAASGNCSAGMSPENTINLFSYLTHCISLRRTQCYTASDCAGLADGCFKKSRTRFYIPVFIVTLGFLAAKCSCDLITALHLFTFC